MLTLENPLGSRDVKVLFFSLLVGFFATAAVAGDDAPRGLVPADYHEFVFVSDPQISPDGNTVAFVRGTVSEDRRSRETSIWLVATDGDSAPRQFTASTSDRSPRWSPDGRQLAFLSSRGERPQLHLIPIAGGEARAITRLEQGSITGFHWLPDNQRLILSLRIDPEVDDPNIKKEEDETPQPDLRRFTTPVYKADGQGYLDESRVGFWLLDTADDSLRRLTGHPDWNDRNPAISPDGQLLAFNADRSGRELHGGFNQDLWLLDLTGPGEPQRLATPEGRAEQPVFSPDGRSLYFTHQAERYAPVTLQRVPVAGGASEQLHDGLAVTVQDLQVPARGQGPFFRADRRGSRPLLRLTRDGGAEVVLGDGAAIAAASFSADGRRVAYVQEDEATLAEVWTARSDGRGARRLTGFNDALLSERSLGRLERFSFTNEAGMTLDGFLLKPVGVEPGQRYPLVLNIKGGPAGMWGHQWFHEFQMLAAAGYGVVFTNYRGSTGYGHAFQSAVRLDYGGADYRDNMQVLETALELHDWIDPDRLFVTGGSHGGFLTNWITTRTDRFRAAVTQRSVSNWLSEAGTQEFPPEAMAAEFGGTLWENFAGYWDRSPLKYADRVTTPTLVIHSDQDLITPLGQGQEWYFALLAHGVETELAMFEGEGHELSRSGRPVNLVARLELILEWFGRFAD
ncbi:MAG: S9 family peptidase [Gammaproteobacteria bacterium]|nr:S9 family peptidase [Gammaproteobacteria bacterium]